MMDVNSIFFSFLFLHRFVVFPPSHQPPRLPLLSPPYLCLPPLLSPMHPPPLLHHPLSVALLFIAMSSQGSAATKAFSCCHYNYSLHTCTHTPTNTHAYMHKRRKGAQQQHCVFVSACVCVMRACSACAVIHKRVSYFYLSPSLSSSPPPTPLHPSLLLLPATFAMLSTGSISRAPTSLLSHTEITHKHTRAVEGCSLGIPQI